MIATEAPVQAGERHLPQATLLVLGVVGIGFRRPTLIGELTVFDLALGAVGGLFLLDLLGGRIRPPAELRAAGPGLWLVLVGTLVASLGVGLAPWVVDELILDVGGVLGGFAAIALMRRSVTAARWANVALLATAGVVALRLLAAEGAPRARAGFPNPNIPGHLLAAVAAYLLFLPVRRVVKLPLLALLGAGIVATGSFGAAILVAVAGIYWAYTAARRATPALRGLARFLLVVGLVVSPFAVLSYLRGSDAPDQRVQRAYSVNRFDRSSTGRVAIWSEAVSIYASHPLGIGPGSAVAEGLLPKGKEVHNEPLSYLLERGPLALVGLGLFGLALWRVGAPGGPLRAVVLAIGVSMLFRNVLHYRHVWMVMALAAVLDQRLRHGTARSLLPAALRR